MPYNYLGREELKETVGLLTGSGPDAISVPLRLSDAPGTRYIEAWISNFGSSNVHILAGSLSLVECQNRLERGFTDVLMTLTAAGVSCCRLPDGLAGGITVFFEAANTSGQAQLVTVRICQI